MCEILEIRVLNLGNADCIILVLAKEEQVLVMIIDTGRDSHLKKILKELSEVLVKYNKPGPDLVICTHYDFDHIGGLEELVGRFKLYIREVWMHTTHRLIEIGNRLEESSNSSVLMLPDEDAQQLGIEGNGIIDYEDEEVQDILQQLKHEIAAIEAIEDMGIPIREPISGRCSLEGWPEVEVAGPSYEYYQSLFPEHFNLGEFIEAERTELRAGRQAHEVQGEGAFERLDNVKRASLTATNLNSAIIRIETNAGIFLFTGDAGIESFRRMPDYENKLRGIFFLKVPHHGSANNLNSPLIRLMDPKIAFISGGSHVSDYIVAALREQGAEVRITDVAAGTLKYPL